MTLLIQAIVDEFAVIPVSMMGLFLLNFLGLGIVIYKKWLGGADSAKKSVTMAGHHLGQKSSQDFLGEAICIQLPVYNEEESVKELLNSVIQMDWTSKKLEIQILDDSTDETGRIIDTYLNSHADVSVVSEELGVWEINRTKIFHIVRDTRDGYKAGALNHGMSVSKADFFAVFDCDFRPRPDFLHRMMPSFESTSKESLVSAVQAPWGFRNTNENFFTKIQSLLLNCHFHVEHRGRSNRGLIFNFNGTAGIWRRSAIEGLGGWSAHSVTEDLYLSLMTWLKGKKIVYVDTVPCESELPNNLTSFLVQQRRWAKGNGQVLRLLGREVLKSKVLTLTQKFDAVWHLLGYSFASLFLTAFLLSPLWLFGFDEWAFRSSAADVGRVLWLSACLLLTIGFYRLFAQKTVYRDPADGFIKRLIHVCSLLMIFPVLSVFLAKSYWVGLFHSIGDPKHLEFNRTPKNEFMLRLEFVDRNILRGLMVFCALCVSFAIELELYVGAIPFVFQFLLLARLYKLEFGLDMQGRSASHRTSFSSNIKSNQYSEAR